ncbi:13633_t:CDS:2 [Gigaspora rosea]|nr:13633_t:CDS:2 [Gigaspora rosea]
MDGGSISTSRHLKKKTRSNKRTFYYWDHNTLLCQETYLNKLGIGRTYFENIRNYLINNNLLSRIYGNIKRMPQWKTKMVIDKGIAEIVKNFLENYAVVYGLPSPGRSINRITQSIVFLPAEMSYKSVHRDFLAGLEEDTSNLGTVKVQEVANGPFAEFNLLKIKKADIYQEIRALSILVLIPSSLDYKRQEYLYNNIRLFVKDEYKDTTCPRPSYAGNK